MNGEKTYTSGPSRGFRGLEDSGRRGRSGPRVEQTAREAWERFVAGEDVSDVVRPEILASWLRCRDEYKVDPLRQHAPNASEEQTQHALEDDIVLAELGGIARSIAGEAEDMGGLAAVADGRGRIHLPPGAIARPSPARARETSHGARHGQSMRWHKWCGHRPRGKSRDGRHAVRALVRWLSRLDLRGIAIRDPITEHPLGVLDISLYKRLAPATMRAWLSALVGPIELELQQQARRSRSELLSAFVSHERTTRGPLIAADNSGRSVAANAEGRRLLGIPEASEESSTPLTQMGPDGAGMKEAILQAVQRALADRSWFGSAEVSLPAVETEMVVEPAAGYLR